MFLIAYCVFHNFLEVPHFGILTYNMILSIHAYGTFRINDLYTFCEIGGYKTNGGKELAGWIYPYSRRK